MFHVVLVGLSKATLRCYTSICDGIIITTKGQYLHMLDGYKINLGIHKSKTFSLTGFPQILQANLINTIFGHHLSNVEVFDILLQAHTLQEKTNSKKMSQLEISKWLTLFLL